MTARVTRCERGEGRRASVELRFEMDTLVLFHTCPHPLNADAELSTKAVRYDIFDGPPASADDPNRLSAPENMRGFENNRIFHLGCCAGASCMIRTEPARGYRRALPQGRARRRVLDARRPQGRDASHRRHRRQSGCRHAVLQRRRSGRALFGRPTPFASRATSI